MDFSDAIRAWLVREYGKTTQTEIARQAGYSTPAVNQFFTGKRRYIRLAVLDRLIAGVGLSGEALVGQAEEAARNDKEAECLRAFRKLSDRDQQRVWDMLVRFGGAPESASFPWDGVERRKAEGRQPR